MSYVLVVTCVGDAQHNTCRQQLPNEPTVVRAGVVVLILLFLNSTELSNIVQNLTIQTVRKRGRTT
jgi:hypothetical protein